MRRIISPPITMTTEEPDFNDEEEDNDEVFGFNCLGCGHVQGWGFECEVCGGTALDEMYI
jgi:hypothetical protein